MSFPGMANYVFPNDTSSNEIVNHARDANNVSRAFNMPLDQNGGMWANILPAALQIEEHKKMMQVASEYQKTYVKNFQDRYGFSQDHIDLLKKDFKQITDQITSLIPDGDMRNMYKKYVESYPSMYLSMIPQEALQTRLAVKCNDENRVLRTEIEKMSACVSTLVQGLSKLQMAAGVPPIVNLMFESMPDPLTSITDPMYHKYNEAIGTYHTLLQDTTNNNGDNLRSKPQAVLDTLIALNKDHSTSGGKSITLDELKALKEVVANMGTQSGCQPFGDEWNHMGPEPAMNPAMCMGEDATQPGNPRHAQGRTGVYQAKRTQDGGAQWVLKGQVPLPGVTNHMQQPAQAYNADPWAGYAGHPQGPAPRVRRTKGKKSSKGKKK